MKEPQSRPQLTERPTLDLNDLASRYSDNREQAQQLADLLLGAKARLEALECIAEVQASATLDDDLALIGRISSAASGRGRPLEAGQIRHVIRALDDSARPSSRGPSQPSMVVQFTRALTLVDLGDLAWRLLREGNLVALLHSWADAGSVADGDPAGDSHCRLLSDALAGLGIEYPAAAIGKVASR